ncbi:UNVERIFIED_CONTAM: hypothetical protein Slati_3625100 [Sesamum latifolium]|uniref:FYVE-type domain-containing protein n=1 Tax=Sesamum latifolium TaxID=2727402 RepID=A0AAW2U0L7_9LAMI
MAMEPPPFQEASRCDVCKCSFSTFRRRHHCRCCGRTLCAEHSADQMALPQYGIHTNVRVCANCFNNGSSTFFNPGQVASSSVNISSADYEATGEAAVFNQTEIAFALMDHGASLDSKNSQGETPVDCAPATLQYRMRKKMKEGMQLDSSSAMHE